MPPRPVPGPAPKRSGLPIWQLVGLGVGALVLVVVGVTLGRMVPLGGTSTPTPTLAAVATPTMAASTATAVPAANSPTPAALAQSPSPVAVAKPTGPPAKPTAPPLSPPPSSGQAVPSKPTAPPNPPGVLAADNFERADAALLPLVSARPTDYTFAYDRGEYVISVINAAYQGVPVSLLSGGYDNSIIAVDVRMMGDVASRYAFLVCRHSSTEGQTNQYRASLVPDGQRVILSRWDGRTERSLASVRDEPAVNPGNAKNRFELRCAGTTISVAVNNKVVVTTNDMTLNRGADGVGAGTFAGVEGTLEARFDNLEVRTP
jgi:hypothetical protein